MTRRVDTTIPGLRVAFQKVASYLYACAIHTESGLVALRFESDPLPFGKREFVRRLDNSRAAEIDWTESADSIMGDVAKALLVRRLRREILESAS